MTIVKYWATLIPNHSGLDGLVVSALNFKWDIVGSNPAWVETNFQTISRPSSYSMCPGLSIKWTGQRLVIDSRTECAWVIHESKAVQMHVHNNHCYLHVPRVPGSIKICTRTSLTILKILKSILLPVNTC